MGASALTELLERHGAAHGVPGAALGLLRRGRRSTAYWGVADLWAPTPVRASTRFAIGSLTKSMVASALMVLVADHRLSLEDPVATHVPELTGSGWAASATLRDLLANRSPIPLRAALEFGFDEHDRDDDRALSRLVQEVAGQPPSGEYWSYSNVGWCVAGRAIEVVTGLAWEAAMPRLLARVGLSGTTWTSSIAGRAVGHDDGPDGPVAVEASQSRAYGPAGTTTASTLEDMLRYAAWHLADPVPSALREVHADVSIPGWLDAWGLGLARFDWDDAEVWGWDGVVNGQRSQLRLLPDREGAVVVLSNGSAGRALGRSVLTEVVHEWFAVDVPEFRLDPRPGLPDQLASYAGTYGWPDRRVEVAESGAGLVIVEDGVAKQAVALDRSTFLVDRHDPDTPTVTFAEFDSAGKPEVLYDMVWGLGRLPDR